MIQQLIVVQHSMQLICMKFELAGVTMPVSQVIVYMTQCPCLKKMSYDLPLSAIAD